VTRHSISLQHVERRLDGATVSPNEAATKAQLKMTVFDDEAKSAIRRTVDDAKRWFKSPGELQ